MNFETLRDNIITILKAAAAGNYLVHAGEVQSKSAEENILTPRLTVYLSRIQYPETSNGRTGEIITEAQFRIEVTVYVQHNADLDVLNDPDSTAAQRAAALTQLKNPDLPSRADALIDLTWGKILQVMLNPINYDYGFSKGIVSDRWITDFQKDNPASQGRFMAISGAGNLSIRIKEDITGETGTPGIAFDNTVDIEGDQGDNLGTSGTLGG